MFLNLIDTALSEKIAQSDDLDQQAKDDLEFLLHDTLTVPMTFKTRLSQKKTNTIFYSIKTRLTSLTTPIFARNLTELSRPQNSRTPWRTRNL